MKWLDILFRGFRPHKSKDDTVPKAQYRDGKYKTSKHCIEKMQEREITKGQLHVNLHTKPLAVEKQIDGKGRPAKIRYSKNKTRSVINPHSNVVASIRKYGNKEFNNVKRSKKK